MNKKEWDNRSIAKVIIANDKNITSKQLAVYFKVSTNAIYNVISKYRTGKLSEENTNLVQKIISFFPYESVETLCKDILMCANKPVKYGTRKHRKIWTNEERAQIIAARANNVTFKQIANYFKVHYHSVHGVNHMYKNRKYNLNTIDSIRSILRSFTYEDDLKLCTAMNKSKSTSTKIPQFKKSKDTYVVGHVDSNNNIITIKSNKLNKEEAVNTLNTSVICNAKIFKLVEMKVISHLEEA